MTLRSTSKLLSIHWPKRLKSCIKFKEEHTFQDNFDGKDFVILVS